ncbi:phage holin family protein [Lysobacter zhanggongensis]|uniref:Phage holin family protein n=1 Tax=Lysobacter zhanggongensis TaxID=1774951 RepID=A0ABU7YS17_9GAMM
MSAQPNPTGTSGTYTGASTDAPHIEPSVGTLLKQLMREVPALLTNEIALAKSEMRENMQQTKAGMASVATGGAVLMGGFVMLLLAGVYALSNVVAPWLAALIVGAVATLIGFAMVQAGKKKLQSESLRPDRTIGSLRRDKDTIRGRTP